MTKQMKQTAVKMREEMMKNIYRLPEAVANMTVHDYVQKFPDGDFSIFELHDRPSKGTVRVRDISTRLTRKN